MGNYELKHVVLPPTAPAQIVTQLRDVDIDAGNSVFFTCAVFGIPQPEISWSRNGTDLSEDSRTAILHQLVTRIGVTYVTSTLQICDLEGEDAGEYGCTAENGAAANTTFTLSVHEEGQSLLNQTTPYSIS